MRITRLAIGAGVVVVGLLCWAAVAGVVVATELLITAGALVALVGGGNWLGGHYAPARGTGARGTGAGGKVTGEPGGTDQVGGKSRPEGGR